ncbi:hypothetical protein BABINDRAFT_158837 [Babjeviella inositovora NRRL Y-12698]|uniref:BAH domain-containing protein n=1 Tax=Babjeviella inositovora NRRL Y-12698 TaxID=984486 RepID=A0A1E3QYN4_9ASCO|nr:uncharacterized protein BABINDRAFT_158837 [Babjeviella inositovora NRRL Y-12698]ODQ82192.1 hypothetical protein BABINDRAFT_158837 [Babjeviella inositovora NRRL Y-12698]
MPFRFNQQVVAERLRPLFEKLYEMTDSADGHAVSDAFHKLPPRLLTEYYKVIRKPQSLHLIRVNLNNKRYLNPQGFVNELAQITWNARFFNEKDSWIYSDAEVIDDYLRNEVIPTINSDPQLNHDGAYQVFYPDLGPLDDVAGYEEPEYEAEDVDNNSEYEEEYVAPSATVSAVAGTPLSTRDSTPAPYGAATFPKNTNFDAWVKRGRPPVIDRPHEQRIKNVLRNLKKVKAASGRDLYLTFDRLPSREDFPEYYAAVNMPTSFDTIKMKIRQRKYADVDAFVRDLQLIVANATFFYDPQNPVYQDAVRLDSNFQEILAAEMAKPDSAYMDPQQGMRIPLDLLDVDGQTYQIGDWVLLNNPNDVTKPTVGQVFRLWQTQDGKRWVNVCWYYRPEQTVHRFDRLFYENEVFKTGQYRDHLAEEIRGHCYVAFFTRFQRGDPAFQLAGPLFICEFRFNDSNKEFNKIRTWKACLPDEVRHVEDPIVPLPGGLRKMPKFDSPLKHLLPATATEDMPMPEPVIGYPNAPPVIGGVYLRPPFTGDDTLGEYSSSAKAKEKQRLNSPSVGLPLGPYKTGPLITNASVANSAMNGLAAISPGMKRTPVKAPAPYGLASPLYKTNLSIHHATTAYTMPSLTNAYTLPAVQDTLTGLLGDVRVMDAVNSHRRVMGAMFDTSSAPSLIWLRGPPVKVAARVHTHHNDVFENCFVNRVAKQGVSVAAGEEANDERMKRRSQDREHDEYVEAPGAGFADGVGLGHSAKYLAYVIKRRKAASARVSA